MSYLSTLRGAARPHEPRERHASTPSRRTRAEQVSRGSSACRSWCGRCHAPPRRAGGPPRRQLAHAGCEHACVRPGRPLRRACAGSSLLLVVATRQRAQKKWQRSSWQQLLGLSLWLHHIIDRRVQRLSLSVAASCVQEHVGHGPARRHSRHAPTADVAQVQCCARVCTCTSSQRGERVTTVEASSAGSASGVAVETDAPSAVVSINTP